MVGVALREGGRQLSQPAECVHVLEAACHRLLRDPKDPGSRADLLEALATYKTVPLDSFPAAVHDLVAASREQADILCIRILETNADAGRSIEQEAKEVCHTLASLGEALKTLDWPGPAKAGKLPQTGLD